MIDKYFYGSNAESVWNWIRKGQQGRKRLAVIILVAVIFSFFLIRSRWWNSMILELLLFISCGFVLFVHTIAYRYIWIVKAIVTTIGNLWRKIWYPGISGRICRKSQISRITHLPSIDGCVAYPHCGRAIHRDRRGRRRGKGKGRRQWLLRWGLLPAFFEDTPYLHAPIRTTHLRPANAIELSHYGLFLLSYKPSPSSTSKFGRVLGAQFFLDRHFPSRWFWSTVETVYAGCRYAIHRSISPPESHKMILSTHSSYAPFRGISDAMHYSTVQQMMADKINASKIIINK